jgi:nicotinamide-nucleotide amidase
VIADLTAAGLTIAVAESLTGGSVVAELVRVPGASAVVRGGVVAYATPLKHSLLGVPAELLAAHGPVHGDVAAAMAQGVRSAAAVHEHPADLGLSTTGARSCANTGSRAIALPFGRRLPTQHTICSLITWLSSAPESRDPLSGMPWVTVVLQTAD